MPKAVAINTGWHYCAVDYAVRWCLHYCKGKEPTLRLYIPTVKWLSIQNVLKR